MKNYRKKKKLDQESKSAFRFMLFYIKSNEDYEKKKNRNRSDRLHIFTGYMPNEL